MRNGQKNLTFLVRCLSVYAIWCQTGKSLAALLSVVVAASQSSVPILSRTAPSKENPVIGNLGIFVHIQSRKVANAELLAVFFPYSQQPASGVPYSHPTTVASYTVHQAPVAAHTVTAAYAPAAATVAVARPAPVAVAAAATAAAYGGYPTAHTATDYGYTQRQQEAPPPPPPVTTQNYQVCLKKELLLFYGF
uniref:Uncharacterized protein n=1 Tax=Meleagris gallopavo TaxID=9103 RepID=A0A803Y9J9_MELGA